jgi:hypothetical protein
MRPISGSGNIANIWTPPARLTIGTWDAISTRKFRWWRVHETECRDGDKATTTEVAAMVRGSSRSIREEMKAPSKLRWDK